jgi:alpha-glucosidase
LGFGSNGSWLPQPRDWGDLSVEAQDSVAGSTLELYREVIGVRSEQMAEVESFEWVEDGEAVLSFDRGAIRVMVNFGPGRVSIPDGEVLVFSDEIDGGLPPDSAVWIRR